MIIQQHFKKCIIFYSKLTTNITLKEIDSYAEMILNYSIDNNEYYTLPGEDQKVNYMMNLLLIKIIKTTCITIVL